ncbi:MAG TPA: sulfotransferase [Caulobacteraceae bacterium]
MLVRDVTRRRGDRAPRFNGSTEGEINENNGAFKKEDCGCAVKTARSFIFAQEWVFDKMNKPTFLCIGAQKAGTSWLYQVLREHKEIWLGPFKEYQYFNSLFVKQHTAWTRWHIKVSAERAVRQYITQPNKIDFTYLSYLTQIANEQLMFTEDWYSHIFSRGGLAVKGDVTPEYCTIPQEGIDYVLRLLGAVPIIYLIRDPLDRALSQLKMNVSRKGIVQPSTESEWEPIVNDWDINNRGDYKTNVTNWLARYPNDRLLFIPYRDIASDPIKVLRQVESHVGVSENAAYSKADARIFEGEKIDLPRFVVDMMQDRVNSQYEFLKTEFGDEFLSRV